LRQLTALIGVSVSRGSARRKGMKESKRQGNTPMLKDDGDIIKACGYLAIYSGNLEDQLDELYGIAISFCPELVDYAHLRFSDKARHLGKALGRAYKIAPDYAQKADEEPRAKCHSQALQDRGGLP
jgi:hypothetical protein